jgi:hypothetical protein
MMDLGKIIPKLPAYAIEYWDRFLGICFVLVALFQGITLDEEQLEVARENLRPERKQEAQGQGFLNPCAIRAWVWS